MALNGFRTIDEADQLVAHELADCMWAVIVIAHELGIALAHAFDTTMDQIEAPLARSFAAG
jgi:NTP pyrophosphatase (non-canonical NTP hydrolase)